MIEEGNVVMSDRPTRHKFIILDEDGRPKLGLGPGTAYTLLQAYFPTAREKIRIASAYFTTSGYKKARPFIADHVKIWILVGKEDGRNVVQTVIEDIVEDYSHAEEDLWEAINDLVTKLRSGELRIVDARAMQVPFHCKFYIVDDKALLHGSSNFSTRGLLQSIEQIGVSTAADEIAEFTSGFEYYFHNATLLTDILIALLEDYLNLKHPFDIYLKTLLILNKLPEYEMRETGYRPVYYQRAVVARMLRQIDKWRSSILIAATGLGKTVMGAEVAFQLKTAGQIKRAILLSPAGNVQSEWIRELEARDIPFVTFTNSIMFMKRADKGDQNQVARLDQQLEQADENTLLIIDEAHIYRNQLFVKNRKGYNSRVIERISKLVNEKRARIILLTATPYSTSLVNLNSLLALLPRLGKKDLWGENQRHKIESINEFIHLPMCSVIGLPHVIKLAHKRGDIDEDGRVFIQYSDRRRYMPKTIRLRTVTYELPIDTAFITAWNTGCFDQRRRARHWVPDEGATGENDLVSASIDYIRNSTIEAWLSSPVALRIAVAKNMLTPDPKAVDQLLWYEETLPVKERQKNPTVEGMLTNETEAYKTYLKLPLSERERYLFPLRNGLQAIEKNYQNDSKLMALFDIVRDRCRNGGKVLIFTTLHATANYLQRALSESFQNLRVNATVDDKALKPIKERQRMQKSFAPKANRADIEEDDILDVLIVTDADGVGVNLQDADTVISYDLPREADKIIQRVGRVLRPTDEKERQVNLYVLYPKADIPDLEMKSVMNKVMDRFIRVTRRHDSAQQILSSPVMPALSIEDVENADKIIHLDRDVDVDALLASSGDILAQLADDVDTSRAIQHQAVLEETRFKERAQNLNDNISSARHHSEKDTLIYALVWDGNSHKYVPILYSQSTKYFIEKEETDLLDLLACDDTTSPALIKAKEVEKAVNYVIRKWCRIHGKNIGLVRKVCAMVLTPKGQDLREFLEMAIKDLDDNGPND
jgi:superfamily II DNA or RNA helicase